MSESVWSQTDSDNISKQYWSYGGNSVTYKDENGNQWQRTSDALGRLIALAEPNGSSQSPSLNTNYSYDLENNLTSVNQLGASGETARVRSFTYDSLSRLLCASNPENSTSPCPSTASTTYTPGTIGYVYDANGNVMNKHVPAPNSTTAGQSITLFYKYDNLNRLRTKFSDDGMTPASCFQYDGGVLPGSFQVGTLTMEWTQQPACPTTALSTISGDAITSRAMSHDAMGRVVNEQQCTPSNCSSTSKYSLAYSYDLAGNVLTYNNGMGSSSGAFTQTFDTANRLQSVSRTWNGSTTYLFNAQPSGAICSQAGYAATGQLENALYGNALTVCREHDSRQHVTSEVDTGTTLGANTTATAAVQITGGEQSK